MYSAYLHELFASYSASYSASYTTMYSAYLHELFAPYIKKKILIKGSHFILINLKI